MPANSNRRLRTSINRPNAALTLSASLLAGPACLTGSYKPDEAATATETTFSSSTSSSTLPGQHTTTTASMTPTGSGSESGTGSDASSSPTAPGVCGDGMVDPGEDCDDGNQTPGDGCEEDCTNTPSCGDGKVDPSEECDDGNDENTDGCVSCTNASCGDGYIQEGVEACDDGPDNTMYGFCTHGCAGLGPRCGDGMVNGPEECDDANQTDDDDCSNDCIAPRVVFVTSSSFSGSLGGLTGADNLCKAIAGVLGKPGAQWRAWLSDDTGSPATRVDTKFTGHYRLVDGTSIARGWDDLTDGSLATAINITETGAMSNGNPVWSNTTEAGTSIPGDNHCKNWDSMSFGDSGRFGSPSSTDSAWTDAPEMQNPINCSTSLHLYCFQHTAR